MHISLDCIPCLVQQSLATARFVTDDPAVHERMLRHALKLAAELDFSSSPPAMAMLVHRELRRVTGIDDPYRQIKDSFNRMALDMLPGLRQSVQDSAVPLFTAVRLAIAGNVIDLGVKGGITIEEAIKRIGNVMNEPFSGDIETFREAVANARRILYLADNAGEIVFDRLLLEQLPRERVTLAVRGLPILNDATMADAEAAGINDLVEVIGNGADAPGTILSECDDNFKKRFAAADLIIAKGQGNYETLSETTAPLFFLLKIKCPVVSSHTGQPLGTQVLLNSGN